MGNHENREQWTDGAVEGYLQKIAESEPIPDRLKPQQMEHWLRQAVEEKAAKDRGQEPVSWEAGGQPENRSQGRQEAFAKQREGGASMGKGKKEETGQKKSYRKWWCGTAAVAACLAVVLFAAGRSIDWDVELEKAGKAGGRQDSAVQVAEGPSGSEKAGGAELAEGSTYQELYQAFSGIWKEQEEWEVYMQERAEDAGGAESSGIGAYSEDGAVPMESSENMDTGNAKEAAEDYGKTNQQEEDVEEADIIKNDGRFLYQSIQQEGNYKYAVQIADTKDGLKEVARIGEFDNEISNIYVWKDTLVVIESGWVNDTAVEEGEQDDGINPLGKLQGFVEDLFSAKKDTAYQERAYSMIHMYDIKDRANPEESHTFTVKGSYQDSRISEGYLYFFSTCNAYKPQLERDYQAYIPEFDGKILSPDKIYLPEDADTAAYLVMASINMEKPDGFTDTTAIVTSADKFYVSQNNIYIAESKYADGSTVGAKSNSTKLYRFSYQDGKMKKEAEGTVKGILQDDMAMNEHKGFLRMVTTVENQNVREVKDDITGEVIGYDSVEFETSNSLYVLDGNLEVAGKIENLAKDERIYSARFFGDAGYFVTFRQTDPLFSVDLSNPRKPKILGELKISGFSEYLHFYSDNLLLGIGMEADETTGSVECLKLSMFDISRPSNVKEQSKLKLEDYDYSEALYNYKAVLIDTDKNLFGFHAEGYHEEDYKYNYLLFTFTDGAFKEVLNIDCSENDIYSGRMRGTYIGNSFYLLCRNGRIEEYSMADGNKLGELVP
ncbi:beta-propeller domain-containing protein [Lachnospiraceae bacterium JLR.KK009]|nr:hypothetical protein C810_04093 [Lachnospiraceae bacterium A2]